MPDTNIAVEAIALDDVAVAAVKALEIGYPLSYEAITRFKTIDLLWFNSKKSDHFSFADDISEEDVVNLFKYFVHDGATLPENINNIKISIERDHVISEDVLSLFNKDTKEDIDDFNMITLYNNPTDMFKEVYKSDYSNGSVILGEALKEQYLEPCLQLLIKQWILRNFLSHKKLENFKNLPFFNIANSEAIIKDLQTSINNKIKQICDMTMLERKKEVKRSSLTLEDLAKWEAEEAEREEKNRNEAASRADVAANIFRWPLREFQLAQRFSWLKLIVGFSGRDIHAVRNQNSTVLEKIKHYIYTYLNISLSTYVIKSISECIVTSMMLLKRCIKGQDDEQVWRGGRGIKDRIFCFFAALITALIAAYLAVWLPFFAAFFAVMGATSLPFSLVRKISNISLGGNWDKALTLIEVFKDTWLLLLAIPIAYGFFIGLGTVALGTAGLSVGAGAAKLFFIVLASPLLLHQLADHYLGTYPRWIHYAGNNFRIIVYRDPHNDWFWHYQGESVVSSLMKIITSFSSLRFISIHGFVGVCVLGVVTAAAFLGIATNITKTLFAMLRRDEPRELPPAGAIGIQIQVQNFLSACIWGQRAPQPQQAPVNNEELDAQAVEPASLRI